MPPFLPAAIRGAVVLAMTCFHAALVEGQGQGVASRAQKRFRRTILTSRTLLARPPTTAGSRSAVARLRRRREIHVCMPPDRTMLFARLGDALPVISPHAPNLARNFLAALEAAAGRAGGGA